MAKKWTVEEVKELFEGKVGINFAATDNGQAHLNRIAKAITNESLDKRVEAMRETNAKKAFDKKVSEVATKTPEKLQALVDRKEAWMAAWIIRKYDTEED
jgi:DNA-binding PadR family transcriptional regulator